MKKIIMMIAFLATTVTTLHAKWTVRIGNGLSFQITQDSIANNERKYNIVLVDAFAKPAPIATSAVKNDGVKLLDNRCKTINSGSIGYKSTEKDSFDTLTVTQAMNVMDSTQTGVPTSIAIVPDGTKIHHGNKKSRHRATASVPPTTKSEKTASHYPTHFKMNSDKNVVQAPVAKARTKTIAKGDQKPAPKVVANAKKGKKHSAKKQNTSTSITVAIPVPAADEPIAYQSSTVVVEKRSAKDTNSTSTKIDTTTIVKTGGGNTMTGSGNNGVALNGVTVGGNITINYNTPPTSTSDQPTAANNPAKKKEFSIVTTRRFRRFCNSHYSRDPIAFTYIVFEKEDDGPPAPDLYLCEPKEGVAEANYLLAHPWEIPKEGITVVNHRWGAMIFSYNKDGTTLKVDFRRRRFVFSNDEGPTTVYFPAANGNPA